MSDDEEEIPDYLKKIAKGGPIKLGDNFGPYDVIPPVSDQAFEDFIKKGDVGFDQESPLHTIFRALIRGNEEVRCSPFPGQDLALFKL